MDKIVLYEAELAKDDGDAVTWGMEYLISSKLPIDSLTKKYVAHVEGIEKLFVAGRYTIRFVVGRLFDDMTVLTEIAKIWNTYQKEII